MLPPNTVHLRLANGRVHAIVLGADEELLPTIEFMGVMFDYNLLSGYYVERVTEPVELPEGRSITLADEKP